MRIGVVGAGFSGLASAALLAKDGYEVTVFERNAGAGGRAGVLRTNGFCFDMGPSWYLMPDVFERFFSEFGRHPSDYYELVRLDPSYRIYFGPSDYVDVPGELDGVRELFEHHEPGAAAKLDEYLEVAEYQYGAAMREFLYKDYRSLFDFFNRRTMVEGRKLHVFQSMDDYARRYFASERLRRILEYSVVFLGGSPKNTPAMYSLLSHVDFNLGVWYPMGGIGSVVAALQALAESQGARILFDHEVLGIATERRNAKALRTIHGEYPVDAVVVTADYAHAELDLLSKSDRTYGERYWHSRTLAPSALLIYLGLSQPLEGLLHHTLSFEHDWMKHFDSIFHAPAWPDKPSYYICCPTKTDNTIAPEGGENLVVLVPLAVGLDDSDSVREKYADRIISSVECLIGQKIAPLVQSRNLFSQRDFMSAFRAFRGTALGLSHTLRQTAVFRPRRRSKRVKNLFYSGQYTHPGIGLPMTLISATVTAQTLAEEMGHHA